jgi:hypothetical protein
MLDLQPFALNLGQSLAIGDLENNVGNVLAEVANERLLSGVRILDRVVQDGGKQDSLIVDACLIGQRNRVVDGRKLFGTLASLVAVLVGGKGDGGDQLIQSCIRSVQLHIPGSRNAPCVLDTEPSSS